MAIYKNSYPFGSIVRSGLVLNLDATNLASYPGSGSLWYDTSGNGNSGSLTNGPTYLQERGRGSIVFDGVNDYVDCGSLASLFSTTAQNLTYNFWINANSLPTSNNARMLFNVYTTGYNGGRVFVIYNNSGVMEITAAMYVTVSNLSTLAVNTNIAVSTWINVCFVWNGTQYSIYQNGVQSTNKTIQTLATPTTGLNNTPVRIAADNIIVNPPFSGSISIAQVYNRALTAAEVQQNFNALRNRFGI